jgi:putative glutamine amidotransferase
MARPVIGVTGPDTGGDAAWWFTRMAIRRSGGIARRITPSRAELREPLDALVVGGGADVSDPGHAQDHEGRELPRRPSSRSWWRWIGDLVIAPLVYALRRLDARPIDTIDPARDRLERSLLAHAAAQDMPVLGICRGAQLMNVCAGGSLHRSLVDFYGEEPEPWTVLPRKRVELDPDSRLARVLRASTCRVNGLHRHAVEAIGRDLRVVARERSGLTQAIEHPTRRFWIGVQWHPEYLPQLPEQRRLFHALVAEAAEHRAQRSRQSAVVARRSEH